MPLSLDIIVPTYNRAHLIDTLVKSLIPQLLSGDHMYVVWQGTDKNALLQKCSENIHHLRLSRPNLPAARNRGIASSKADIILFLDDDAVPAPDLVLRHRACYNDPKIAGVAGYVDDQIFERDRPRPSFIDLSRGDLLQNFACASDQDTVSAMGANMSFRRSALLDICGFDEHYKNNALWEEVDCCMRLLAQGRTLRYCAGAKAKHLREERGGCRDIGRNRYLYHRFANTVYFALRFARPENYHAWFTTLKYRLEFLSRGSTGRDHSAVLAGMAGMAGGATRFVFSLLSRRHQLTAAEKTNMRSALTQLGSKG